MCRLQASRDCNVMYTSLLTPAVVFHGISNGEWEVLHVIAVELQYESQSCCASVVSEFEAEDSLSRAGRVSTCWFRQLAPMDDWCGLGGSYRISVPRCQYWCIGIFCFSRCFQKQCSLYYSSRNQRVPQFKYFRSKHKCVRFFWAFVWVWFSVSWSYCINHRPLCSLFTTYTDRNDMYKCGLEKK